jgi:DNA-binding SARP family transcriptional activator
MCVHQGEERLASEPLGVVRDEEGAAAREEHVVGEALRGLYDVHAPRLSSGRLRVEALSTSSWSERYPGTASLAVLRSIGVDEFRLLGPLEVLVDGKPLRIAALKPRALLALLLLNRNRVVPTERLVDELWGEEAPARATKTLQVYVSQLRKALGPERLVTRPPGYELRVNEGELDVDRFEALAARARAATDPKEAAAGFREALELWRGPALREFRSAPFVEIAAARLDDLRLLAVEDRIQAELDAGAAAEVVPELEELVAAEPLRERPRELLMLALYRSGRQADALDLYRRTRQLFVNELGIDPGPGLRELEQAVLRQDSDLRVPERRRRAAPPGEPPARRRRWPVLVAIPLVFAAMAVAALILDGGGNEVPQRGDSDLRPFVFKLENFLAQSHDGREQVGRAVAGAVDCRLSPAIAEARLDSVQRNRQSILQQLAALSVPAGEAPLRASDLLQKAIAASIAADSVYRDWLRTRRSCRAGELPPPAARRADSNATRLKRRFLVVFDPLARRFDQRIWRPDEL